MQRRTGAVLSGCVLAATLATVPAQARLGVDEEASTPSYVGAAAPMAEGASTAGHQEDEGFVIRSSDGKHKLMIGGRLQARLDAIDWDDAIDVENTATFQLRRARLYFIGHVMGESNKYFVQVGADTRNAYLSDSTSASDLKVYDAWFKHVHSDTFAVKVGQGKVPFSRQNLTSSGKLQFPDRALATETLGFDARDVGLELSGGFEDGMVQYAAAVVNGDGPNTLNLDNTFAFYGRASVNPTGDYGYDEGDAMGREEMASTIGFALNYNEDQSGDLDVEYLRLNVDAGIKCHGFSAQGEFYSTRVEPDGIEETTTRSYYLQGGYFLRPEKLEVVARASRIFYEGDDNDEGEYAFGLNLMTWGHRLKWQAAYSFFDLEAVGDDGDEDISNHRFTAQGQLWF